jgi:hypothetical protein
MFYAKAIFNGIPTIRKKEGTGMQGMKERQIPACYD